MLESNACGEASWRREPLTFDYSGYVPNYRLMKKFWLNQAKTGLSSSIRIDWLIDWLTQLKVWNSELTVSFLSTFMRGRMYEIQFRSLSQVVKRINNINVFRPTLSLISSPPRPMKVYGKYKNNMLFLCLKRWNNPTGCLLP